MKSAVIALLSVCFCLQLAHRAAAATVLVGEVATAYQTFSDVSTDSVVSTSFGICSTSAPCPLTVVTGAISSTPQWPDIKAKFHDPNAWITLSYTWGTAPNTVTHVNSHFQVSRLFSSYVLSQPGETWNTIQRASSFAQYDFDSMDFPLTFSKEFVHGFEPTPYDYNVSRAGFNLYGHTVAAALPEPSSLGLCLAFLGCALFRRR